MIEKQAQKADAFLQSIGVNTSVSRRGETLEQTVGHCKYLGVRWIRTGYEGDIPIDDQIALFKRAGVKSSYGLLSGGTDIPRLIDGANRLATAGALLAIEGSNEPNNWTVTYKGLSGGASESWMPIAILHRDLYQAVISHSVLHNYPVWSLSENGAQSDNTGLQFLTIPRNADTLMPSGTQFADFANAHNYFSHPARKGYYDNQTWLAAAPGSDCPVDGLFGNYGITWAKNHKGYSEEQLENLPRVTTETGVLIDDVFTEEIQARLYLNLYLSQFTRGWRYTAVYLLRDRSDEVGNQSFGFYRTDNTPRKSAHYLHNLTTILSDEMAKTSDTDAFDTLRYEISNQPPTVHELLLQKSDGSFWLVVWGEHVKGESTVMIRFDKSWSRIILYDPTVGTTPTKLYTAVKQFPLTLTDHPLLLELRK